MSLPVLRIKPFSRDGNFKKADTSAAQSYNRKYPKARWFVFVLHYYSAGDLLPISPKR